MDPDDILKALSHPVRRDILNWLKNPETHFPEQHHPLELGVCANQIERRCDVSQSTVSAHLATLQRAGLIDARKIGQWVLFQRNEPAIAAFMQHLQADLLGGLAGESVGNDTAKTVAKD